MASHFDFLALPFSICLLGMPLLKNRVRDKSLSYEAYSSSLANVSILSIWLSGQFVLLSHFTQAGQGQATAVSPLITIWENLKFRVCSIHKTA